MTPGERARAMITAQVAGDVVLRRQLTADMTVDDLAAVSGALLAMCGNLVTLLSHFWECTPEKAWETVLTGERAAEQGG